MIITAIILVATFAVVWFVLWTLLCQWWKRPLPPPTPPLFSTRTSKRLHKEELADFDARLNRKFK